MIQFLKFIIAYFNRPIAQKIIILLLSSGIAILSSPWWVYLLEYVVSKKLDINLNNANAGRCFSFYQKTADGKTAGHVGLYVGEDAMCYHVLGGNQSDKVCISRKEKTRLYTSRRPNYNIQPANVRKIILSSSGQISNVEQ